MMQSSLPDLLSILLWLALLLSLLLAVLGFRGRMEVMRGRCSSCLQELHDPLPQRCAECGAELRCQDGISWGRVAIRPRLIAAAAVLGLAATTAFVLLSVWRLGGPGGRAAVRQSATMDPQQLRAMLEGLALKGDGNRGGATSTSGAEAMDPTAQPIWSELAMASSARALPAEQLVIAAEVGVTQTLDRMNEAGSYSRQPLGIFEDAISSGLLDSARLRNLFDRLTTDLELLAPRTVQPGEAVFLVPSARLLQLLDFPPGPAFTIDVVDVRQGGRSLPLVMLAPSRISAQINGGGGYSSPSPAVRGVRLEALGLTELDVGVAAVLGGAPVLAVSPGVNPDPVATPDPDLSTELVPASDQDAAPRSAPERVPSGSSLLPDGRTVIPLRTFRIHVEVVEPQGRVLDVLDDPRLDQRVRSAVTVERLLILPHVDGRRHVVEATVALSAVDECALSFQVWASPAGRDPGSESSSSGIADPGSISLGWIEVPERAFAARAARDRGQTLRPTQFTLQAWADEPLASADGMHLRLEPMESRWIGPSHGTRRWGRAVVLRDLPIERTSAGQGATGGGP